MRFIACSPASPILSLHKVQGIVPPNKNSPFSQLDAVYAYILGQVEDSDAVKVLLAIKLLNSNFAIADIMMAYHPTFSREVFDTCLSELAPLLSMTDARLQFFHASFPDFLCDQTRSREYYLDLETFCTRAFTIWWRTQSPVSLNSASLALQKIQRPTSAISGALMDCHPSLNNLRCSLDIQTFVRGLHRIVSCIP